MLLDGKLASHDFKKKNLSSLETCGMNYKSVPKYIIINKDLWENINDVNAHYLSLTLKEE
jgi:hypothetical protein